jgi:putative flavoprotein involved in K+ transport
MASHAHNPETCQPVEKQPVAWRQNWLARKLRDEARRVLQYLQNYAAEHSLPITPGVESTSVQRGSDGWRVHTAECEFTCRLLVNATGYFSNPFTPEVPGIADSKIPHVHVADYRDPAHVAHLIGKFSGNVLIVGKRLSAGQTMLELHESGFEVSLSHRTPIEFGADEFGWWLFFRIFPYLEWMRLKRLGTRAISTPVRMQGGRIRKLLVSGRVKTFGGIQQFEADQLLFADGRRAQFDLVIFATGFRPALRHLESLAIKTHPHTGVPVLDELESVSTPGLFFLGLDQGRNFQSRFIRGIRNDAAFLAERLRRRLALQITTGAGECL